MTSPSEPELLTVEEFARRYRVGRSTVFYWIASRMMIRGVHYFQIGKTIRIPWSMDLLAALSTLDVPDSDVKPERSGKHLPGINLDY